MIPPIIYLSTVEKTSTTTLDVYKRQEQGDVTQILSHLLFLSLDQKILILDTHTHFVWI